MSKKTAFITGIGGQDGAYLAEFLLKKKYVVIGGDRRSSRNTFWRLKYLNILNKIKIIDFELSEITNIIRVFKEFKIDEFYNLAAQSFVHSSFKNPLTTSDSNAIGVLRILDTIRTFSPETKFFQASTSELFGDTETKSQNEKTIFNPRSPYAISKLFAHHMTINYRDAYNLFACCAITFNHESPLRSEEFVTKKITKSLVAIKNNKLKFLELGNLNVKRDWGFAGEYTQLFWKILQQKKPEEFVISTNETHTIKEFVNEASKYCQFKLKWIGKGINERAIDTKTNRVIVKINKEFFRPTEVNYLKGNNKLIKKQLSWEPKYNFKKLVKIMMEYELNEHN